MPVCIHCSTRIESLYMRYGRDHIVLSPCHSAVCSPPDRSKAAAVVLADEYLEHDLPIVIIDLILAKPQAYRHLLFNRASIFTAPAAGEGNGGGGEDGEGVWWGREVWEMSKRVLALAMVDGYVRWFYTCVQPAASLETSGSMSDRLATKLSMQLPVQAGIFFPSLFTPQATPSAALNAVCSSTPLWSSAITKTQDAIYSTLISYLNMLLITLLESTALHLTTTLLFLLFLPPTHIWLPTKAILLSQLSPLLLLTFVLLWSTKFPHPDAAPAPDRAAIVWIIRTFLSSLNAGVALATILPPTNSRLKVIAPAAILAAAWTAQAVTSAALYSWLS